MKDLNNVELNGWDDRDSINDYIGRKVIIQLGNKKIRGINLGNKEFNNFLSLKQTKRIHNDCIQLTSNVTIEVLN